MIRRATSRIHPYLACLALLLAPAAAPAQEGRDGEEKAAEAADPAEDEVTSDECRAWLRDTYRVGELAVELGLDLEEWIVRNVACVDGDLAVMPASIPRGWCDNVFKVHCSGVDLLAEIGDSLVARCETELGAALGLDLGRERAWNVCGEQKVFDAYSLEGRVSDVEACRAVLLDECGWTPDEAESASNGS